MESSSTFAGTTSSNEYDFKEDGANDMYTSNQHDHNRSYSQEVFAAQMQSQHGPGRYDAVQSQLGTAHSHLAAQPQSDTAYGHPATFNMAATQPPGIHASHQTHTYAQQDQSLTGAHAGLKSNPNYNSANTQQGLHLSAATAASTTPPPALHFTNPQQAMQAFTVRVVDHHWRPDTTDPSIPRSQEAREAYVKRLRGAFLDVTTSHDQMGHRDVIERWSQIAMGHDPRALYHIEFVCWKLLEMAVALHSHGPKALRILDSGKLKKVHTSRLSLFEERIEDMCDVMRISKSRCDTLLAMDDLQMFVGAPKLMGSLSRKMKHNNAERQKQLVVGRQILNNGGVGSGYGHNE